MPRSSELRYTRVVQLVLMICVACTAWAGPTCLGDVHTAVSGLTHSSHNRMRLSRAILPPFAPSHPRLMLNCHV